MNKKTYRQYRFGEPVIISDDDFFFDVFGRVTKKLGHDKYTITIYSEELGYNEFTIHAKHLKLAHPPSLKAARSRTEESE